MGMTKKDKFFSAGAKRVKYLVFGIICMEWELIG